MAACLALALAGCGVAGQPSGFAAPDDAGMPGGGAPDAWEPVIPDPTDPADHSDLAKMCGATPVTAEDWERCFVKRKCEWKFHCEEWNLFSSAQECIALNDAVNGGELSFAARERERSVAAGMASINVANFTQCLIDNDAQTCPHALLSEACAKRFTGTVADGSSCRSDAECASPNGICAPQDCGSACCLGTCTHRGRVGDPCGFPLDCEPGLACSTNSTCVPGNLNDPCGDGGDCDPELWCDVTVHKCKADTAPGSVCQSILQCSGETTCVGLIIDLPQPRCSRVTHEGDPCDFFCDGNLFCDKSGAGKGLGVCRALPKHNEPCSTTVPCVGANDICTRSLCTRRPDIGQTCRDGQCLPGLFCTDQLQSNQPVCQRPLPDNEGPCNQPEQCQSHICSGSPAAAGTCQAWRDTCP